jgi:hypothetical protein
MLSVNETAYPRFKTNSTPKDLTAIYTPNPEEIGLANRLAQRIAPRVSFLVLLKTFQRLGYFPKLTDVPSAIIHHISLCISVPQIPRGLANYDRKTRTRHIHQILKFLKVTAYGKAAESTMNQAMISAAATKDDIADIINVAIEELIRQRFELPGFSILVRAAKKARFKVNNGYFRILYQLLGNDAYSGEADHRF